MGRTKGSLNRKGKAPVIKLKRKRGRPKGSGKKVQEVIEPPSNVKSIKFLGHCPKCQIIIGKTDLESKTIYICPGCGHRGEFSSLKKDRPKEVMSKKDYLETINAEHYDMPSMNDHDPGELKIQQ